MKKLDHPYIFPYWCCECGNEEPYQGGDCCKGERVIYRQAPCSNCRRTMVLTTDAGLLTAGEDGRPAAVTQDDLETAEITGNPLYVAEKPTADNAWVDILVSILTNHSACGVITVTAKWLEQALSPYYESLGECNQAALAVQIAKDLEAIIERAKDLT